MLLYTDLPRLKESVGEVEREAVNLETHDEEQVLKENPRVSQELMT